MSRKRPEQHEESGVDEWVVTYGDCMSLLLTFFILLFSFSTIDAQKWKNLVASMRGDPDVLEVGLQQENSVVNLFDENSVAQLLENKERDGDNEQESEPVPTQTPLQTAGVDATATPEATEPQSGDDSENYYEYGVDNDIFLKLYYEIIAYQNQADLDGGLGVYKTETEIILRFQDNLMFDSGKADINAASLEVLSAIVPMLGKYEADIGKVRIEGHTDTVPINNSNFRDNYELSAARAINVLRYIKDNGAIPPEKLIAMGYGEYSPIATNETEEGRAMNRRTDIVLVANSD